MKARLLSLAWATPWMFFMIFPISSALTLPSPTQRAGVIGTCLLLAAANIATWLTNPPPGRNSFTRPFVISHACLAGASLLFATYAWSVGVPFTFMMFSYLLVAWIFQAPLRYLLAGIVPIVALAGVFVAAEGANLWSLAFLAMPGVMVLAGRFGMERSAREQVRHREAIQRAKASERIRLSADLHDILGHSLTGIAMLSELAGRLLDAGRTQEAREQIREITSQSHEALADVRRIVAATRALSPAQELDEARALLDIARIDVDIVNSGEPASGPRSSAAAHVIREGVTNALLHSRASLVRVTLSPDGVSVVNNGYSQEYAASTAGSGSGLAGLTELVGHEGTLTWGPSGDTWTLTLTFPRVDSASPASEGGER